MNDLDLCLDVVKGYVNHCGVNSSKTTGARLQIWYTALYGECRAGAQIIFPKSGRRVQFNVKDKVKVIGRNSVRNN